ncbi:3'-5' exonuclease [Pseudomonas fluorescens]|uniref:3'-5' exonuclease n=1 Tax=Pseudomonas fluorescens TaxID=294 RepID=UPI0006937BE5|nr:3'-5' exonuclease [Pseudomonas fluorescens]
MSKPRAEVAIDLETLSTSPAAKLLSIGAVAVCAATGQTIKFYTATSVASQPVRKTDASTLDWWSTQSPDARKAFDYAHSDECPTLAEGLTQLTDWLGKLGETHDVHVWGNGADFDIGILNHAYKEISPFVPWYFRNVRDMRTLYDITKRFGLEIKVPRVGTHHNALDDAQFQADVIMESLRQLDDLASQLRAADALAAELVGSA